LKDVVFCAANSTCGKPNVVACSKPVGACLDDPTPGDGTKDGECDIDASAACDTNADCAVESCGITSTDQCADAGGTAGSGSCCPE
jgi:hypothetical protein